MEAAVRSLPRHQARPAHPERATACLLRRIMQGLSPRARRGARRRALREALKPTPARLRASLFLAIAASLLWGVSATITAANRASAANDLVANTGPVSFYA